MGRGGSARKFVFSRGRVAYVAPIIFTEQPLNITIRRLRTGLIALALTFTATPVLAASAADCPSLLLGDLARRLTRDPIETESVRHASHRFNRFRIDFPDGQAALLRAPNARDDTRFEVFASALLREAGVATPELALLDEEHSARFLYVLTKRYGINLFGRAREGLRHDKPRISVSRHLAGLRPGAAYLAEGWGSPLGRKPEFIWRIRGALRSAAFDFWGICEVVGVYDPHADNWGIHDERFVGFDLAMPHEKNRDGRARLSMQFNPFALHLDHVSAALLRDHMSDEMIAFLKRLTKTRVRAVAERTDYVLTPPEERGILARRDALLAADDQYGVAKISSR